MSDRITGDWVRENLIDRFWLGRDRLAAQLDADAALASRLERAERERDGWQESARQFANSTDFYRGLVQKIGEGFGVAARTSDDGSVQEYVLVLKVPELVEDLRAAASQWAAVRKVRDHPERGKSYNLYFDVSRGGHWFCQTNTGHIVSAPDIEALAAKLDALAEARKPKVEPEVWRMRNPLGWVSETSGRSAAEIQAKLGLLDTSTPVRETVNPDGSIVLTPEGV